MDAPNIVIVLCDTLRRDVLDLYGGEVSTRPLLEALGTAVAYRGHSNSFWTIPSHFSLFTGLPPSRHGVHEAPGRNRIEDVMELGRQRHGTTLAWELRKRGYETIMVSSNVPNVSPSSGLDSGFRTFVPNDWASRLNWPRPGLSLADEAALGEANERYRGSAAKALIGELRRGGLAALARLAGMYLRPRAVRALAIGGLAVDKGAAAAVSTAAQLARREPFMLFVNLMEAHEPYYYDSKFDYRYATCRRCVKRELMGYVMSAGACIRAAAWLANAMRSRGLLGRALFVLTSDHGQEFMEHGALGHASGHLYEEDVGVPMIVRPPEGVKLADDACYVGLHELYGLAIAAASGEREWSPSCGPGLAESYDGVAPDPSAGKGIRRVAVFEGDRRVAYRLDGGDWIVEEAVVGGRQLNPRSGETKKIAEGLATALPQ